MVRILFVIFLLLSVPLFAGCVGFQQAVVPSASLTDGWKKVDEGSGERWFGLGAKWAHVTYQVDPPRSGPFDDGPYPASLQVMSIDTPGRLDREEVSEKLDRQVRENARAQRLDIDNTSKRSGERDLASGVRTIWFTYDARIASGSTLFDAGRQARVIGEVWYDEAAGVTVVSVGLAQIQGGGATGQYFVDETHWGRIVADPRGSIGGFRGDDGMIYRVETEAA